MKSKASESQLRELSKDEESYKKLRKLYHNILSERDDAERNLKLLEAAVRSDYDSIIITELELEEPGPRIVYVNDGFCRMTGYARKEVIGKTPRMLQGPDTDRAVLDHLKERLSKGQSFFGQAVNYRKDGSKFINQWDIHPLADQNGKVTHWVCFQHDISERKRAEKVLMDAQVEFDRLPEASKRTIVDVSLHGDILMANRSFRELTGYAKEELRAKKVWELFPRKYRESLRSRFGEGQEPEAFSEQTLKGILLHRSGVPIQVQGEIQVMDLKGQTVMRAEITNISLQKRILEAIRCRGRDYGPLMEKVSEFTYQLVMSDDQGFRFDYFSDEFSSLTGVASENITQGADLTEYVHAEDVPEVKNHFRKVWKDQADTCEYRIRSRNGGYVRVIDYGRLWQHDRATGISYIKGAVSLRPVVADKSKSQSIH